MQITFDTNDLTRDERELLQKLLGIAPVISTMEPAEPAPESQKSATIAAIETGMKEAAAKTEIIGDAVMEDFVPPPTAKRGRKPKTVEPTADAETRPQESEPPLITGDEDLVAVPVVTDRELQEACGKKMQAGVGQPDIATRIRNLIATYVQTGQGASMIPQAARTGFLAKLEAL